MSVLTSKGQVTIPKPVRELLGLRPGHKVEFDMANDGRVYLRAESSDRMPSSRFKKLRGTLKANMSTDQIMALTRPEADDQ